MSEEKVVSEETKKYCEECGKEIEKGRYCGVRCSWRKAQRKYYKNNREKVLARNRERRAKMKEAKNNA